MMDGLRAGASLLNELPPELKSRKLFLSFGTMILVILMAAVGSIVVHFFGSVDLWQKAMDAILLMGGGGVAAQAVPDALQAKNGTYRTDSEVINFTEKSPPPIDIDLLPVAHPVIDYTIPTDPVTSDSSSRGRDTTSFS